MTQIQPRRRLPSIGRYIFVGIVTVAPLWVTWQIFFFLFTQLAKLGRPWVRGLATQILPTSPDLGRWLLDDRLLNVIAALLVLTFLLALGWATTRVIGRRLVATFEALIGLIPFVDTVYRSTKKFLSVAGTAPEGQRRVVLVNFPTERMRTVGLLMRTIRDTKSGQDVAAVYIPTAPNPTSGYIEIVPLADVTFIDWTFDQAMAFVITGGSSAPDTINYS